VLFATTTSTSRVELKADKIPNHDHNSTHSILQRGQNQVPLAPPIGRSRAAMIPFVLPGSGERIFIGDCNVGDIDDGEDTNGALNTTLAGSSISSTESHEAGSQFTNTDTTSSNGRQHTEDNSNSPIT
jgi:hypothetical protein